ncbi:MAG: hypothetical protein WAW37_12925 [Syntrophobacteraceae bacterium]
MISISELNLGFTDAENYQRRENKELFNKIFVKNIFLQRLLNPSTFFLIGEKGTGKTAYAVFLANNVYNETKSVLKYIRETDYQKFILLKQKEHLQLSDYTNIWKVIILLLLADTLDKTELEHNPFSKTSKIRALKSAIDDYYCSAFSPEIISALDWVEHSKVTAELISKKLKLGGEKSTDVKLHESRFQVNLMYIQRQFESALNDIKLKNNRIIFIDGIDIRPGTIPYHDYLECVKGLANAIWSLNNDFFPKIRDSKGRFRAILLVRPDIFSTIAMQNTTNKIRDNSVFLDWRTTYPSYRTSQIFILSDKLLSSQQPESLELGQAWDHYFPWTSYPTSPARVHDPSFVNFLRISYSRPRDIVSIMQILQDEFNEKTSKSGNVFTEKDFNNKDFENKYSEYLMSSIKDQLAFYYNEKDYGMFLRFFSCLPGRRDFNYDEYVEAYNAFTDYVINHHTDIPEFIETPEKFLQFLYDTNIICFIEDTETEPLFRWCYRERSPSNMSPKVALHKRYRIHYGLGKALNVGALELKRCKGGRL